MSAAHYFACLLLLLAGCRANQAAFRLAPPRLAHPTLVVVPPAAGASTVQPEKQPKPVGPTNPPTARARPEPLRLVASKAARPLARLRPARHQELSRRRPAVLGKPHHSRRDYTPLVLAILLAALAVLLLSATAVGLAGSYVPAVGVLVLLLAGFVYFHWRYENR